MMPSISRASCRPTAPLPAAANCPGATRWPDAVRDDVLARLLALNAERYAEEVALGLRSKGGRPQSTAFRAEKNRGKSSNTTKKFNAFQLSLKL